MFLSGSARVGPHHALRIRSSEFTVDPHQWIRVFSVDPHEWVCSFFCESTQANLHFFLQICLSESPLFSADPYFFLRIRWSGSALFFADPLVRVHSIFCGSAPVGSHFFCEPARTVHAGTPCGSVLFLSSTACRFAQYLSSTACGSANQGLYFLLAALSYLIGTCFNIRHQCNNVRTGASI